VSRARGCLSRAQQGVPEAQAERGAQGHAGEPLRRRAPRAQARPCNKGFAIPRNPEKMAEERRSQKRAST